MSHGWLSRVLNFRYIRLVFTTVQLLCGYMWTVVIGVHAVLVWKWLVYLAQKIILIGSFSRRRRIRKNKRTDTHTKADIDDHKQACRFVILQIYLFVHLLQNAHSHTLQSCTAGLSPFSTVVIIEPLYYRNPYVLKSLKNFRIGIANSLDSKL